ncbi:Putative LOC101234561 [Caligus rogercresseyi]|uniref:LOC101234561 n=1 Tax=Caligus rogercresseyi TaxID=217165 RepID=A0A7T8GPZ9_CALRO|nr:Putative LOC101234561 [Caligus rogercresseyi]
MVSLPCQVVIIFAVEQCVLGERGVSEGTKAYLKARARKLDEREKIVALLVDEVATAKRVEYSNGAFFGYEEMEPTKTVLPS